MSETTEPEHTPTRPGYVNIGQNMWQRLPEDHPESLGNLAMAKHKAERAAVADPSDEAIIAANVPESSDEDPKGGEGSDDENPPAEEPAPKATKAKAKK